MCAAVVVGVCVKSQNNEVLMVEEAHKEVKGLLNFPMGKWDDGETVFAAAIRETKEESGYDVELKSILSIQNYQSPRNGSLLKITFNGEIVSGEAKYDGDEISAVKWIPIDDLLIMSDKELRTYKSTIEILKAAKEGREYPLELIENIDL